MPGRPRFIEPGSRRAAFLRCPPAQWVLVDQNQVAPGQIRFDARSTASQFALSSHWNGELMQARRAGKLFRAFGAISLQKWIE
jgi:hypothetical protein